MSDNKKYYYMKLKEDFFDTDPMIMLESLQNGYMYSNILMKLYCRSLKNEGRLAYNDRIPYNSKVIADFTRMDIDVVEKALTVFRDLELIEILDSGAIYMMDIQQYIGHGSTEGERKAEYRERIKNEKHKLIGGTMSQECPTKCPDIRPPEIRDESLEIRDIEIYIVKNEEEKEFKNPSSTTVDTIPYKDILNLFNGTCTSLPNIREIKNDRQKRVRAIWKDYKDINFFKELFEKVQASDFLSGRDGKWTCCSFDWITKQANLTKILEGNYNNKEVKNNGKDASSNRKNFKLDPRLFAQSGNVE